MENAIGPGNFDALFDSYQRLAYGTALRILRDAHEAEDVAQDVFLKVWAMPALFRGGNVESWVTTLAKNRAIDVLRRKKREFEVRSSINDRSNSDSIAYVCAARLDVRAALGALTELQCIALNECFVRCLTHTEAAESLGWPVGTVKTRVRAGLQRLRQSTLVR